MTTEFDPYRKWLGIPQAELPPNHYRLLGIASFEDDPDVIENAADRSMAHIQTFKTGKHGHLTQRLLNELSAAKLCLLNPDKKSAYDVGIRNQIGTSAAKPLTVATKVIPQARSLAQSQPSAPTPQSVEIAKVAQDVPTAPQHVVVASNPGSVSKRGKNKRKKDLILYAVSLGVALVLVAGVVIVLGPSNSSTDDKPNSETAQSDTQTNSGKAKPSQNPRTEKDAEAKPPSDVEADGSSPFEEVPKTSDPVNTDDVANPANETPDVPVNSGGTETKPFTLNWRESPFSKRAKLDRLALDDESILSTFDVAAIVEPSDKPPIPSDAELSKALEEVREAFESDYKDADSPEKKLALARRMYQVALEEADGATRFALLKAAHDITLNASQANASLRIADAISKLFETGGIQFHAGLLDRAWADPSKNATSDSIATATLLLVERAVVAGEFELAQRLLDQAKTRAGDSKSPAIAQAVEVISDELPVLETSYSRAQKAIATLEPSPNDPQAAATAGRFMCFVLGDWEQGLTLLSRVDDPAVKAAAESDLASPSDPLERVKTGDLWWELSEKSADSIRLALRTRAAYWYERTAGQLRGLTKERIAMRLDNIREEAKDEALADLANSTRAQIGQYVVKSTNRKSNQTTYSIWELRDDLTATADGTAVARWEATDSNGFKLMFLDAPKSPVYLRFRGPKVPLTGARTLNGVTRALEFARLTVVAVWEHKTESVKTPFGPITPGSSETLTFYSNGRVNDPLGQIAWLVQGRNLAIDWGKSKKTVAVLSPDGTLYKGKTTRPTGFGRTTITAEVNGRRIGDSD